jgi:hypothetical protein
VGIRRGRDQTVRACICYRKEGSLYRAVWFTESNTGLYLGYYGSKTEHHHSFHADGRRHLRTRNGKDLLPKAKDMAIKDIHGCRQLLNVSLPLAGLESHTDKFRANERGDVVGMLDAPTGRDRVSMDYCLLHRSEEVEFLANLGRPSPMFPFQTLLLCMTIALEHFPKHKVSFVVHELGPASTPKSDPLTIVGRKSQA